MHIEFTLFESHLEMRSDSHTKMRQENLPQETYEFLASHLSFLCRTKERQYSARTLFVVDRYRYSLNGTCHRHLSRVSGIRI